MFVMYLHAVFVINFIEVEYTYEEGAPDAEVCLTANTDIARQATATVSSFADGTAIGNTIPFCNGSIYIQVVVYKCLHLSLIFPCAEGQDYTRVISQSVVFLPGAPAAHRECFTVTIIDDNIAEGKEFFFLVIVSTSQGAVIGTANETTVFITDNDGEHLEL